MALDPPSLIWSQKLKQRRKACWSIFRFLHHRIWHWFFPLVTCFAVHLFRLKCRNVSVSMCTDDRSDDVSQTKTKRHGLKQLWLAPMPFCWRPRINSWMKLPVYLATYFAERAGKKPKKTLSEKIQIKRGKASRCCCVGFCHVGQTSRVQHTLPTRHSALSDSDARQPFTWIIE